MLAGRVASLTRAAWPAAAAAAAAGAASLLGCRLLSELAASGQPQDKILLRGLVFHGHHGVFPEENKLGQKFTVDATLVTDLSLAGTTDDFQNTINYAKVYEDIQKIVEGPPAQLIEAVAERIAEKILKAHPSVALVTVGVAKPHVAVAGVLHSLGVEVTRRRLRQPKTPGYHVAYVGNLPWDADEAALTRLFEPCGVTTVRLHTEKGTGKPRGFAHVHFKDEGGLEQAVKMNGSDLQGRSVRVGYAKPKKDGGAGSARGSA